MAANASPGVTLSNRDLRTKLEGSAEELLELFEGSEAHAGTARYLEGGETQVQSILAFLQPTLRKAFSGVFRERGAFSVRDFVRRRGGRALFIEYDISVGSGLLPVYRVLMDLAMKEALGFGRQRLQTMENVPDNFYFVLDEFALLPRLSHVGDGINFGRELGLRFLVATQNVNQIFHGYPSGAGESILSGFGTVLAFRLADKISRDLVPGAVRHQSQADLHLRAGPPRGGKADGRRRERDRGLGHVRSGERAVHRSRAPRTAVPAEIQQVPGQARRPAAGR